MLGTQEKQTLESAQNANLHCGIRKRELTQKRLKEILYYNPTTGLFIWRISPGGGRVNGDVAGNVMMHGYISIMISGKNHRAHRLAWFYMEGYFPENDIDHINRNRADNRFVNLKLVNRQCNLRNTGNRKDNTSGIKGLCWNKKARKWQSSITISGKDKYLGIYIDFDDAVCARLAAEQCLNWGGLRFKQSGLPVRSGKYN